MSFEKGICCCPFDAVVLWLGHAHHNCLGLQVGFRVGVFEQKVTPWGKM